MIGIVTREMNIIAGIEEDEEDEADELKPIYDIDEINELVSAQYLFFFCFLHL